MTVRCEVLDSLDALAPALDEWDALAVAAASPYAAPAWALAWWRNCAPARAELRVLVARDDDDGRLVGIAPFAAVQQVPGAWRYSLLASAVSSRIEPLAVPEARAEVAAAFVEALARVRPRPALVQLANVPVDSVWPELLDSGWPRARSASLYADPSVPAPTVRLDSGGVDEWLAERSSNFRQQMRRARRKLEKEGAVFRRSTDPGELPRDLAEFKRLHDARWSWRGGSASMTPGVDAMLADAGRELLPCGRFRLGMVEVEGRPIVALLFVAAGDEIAYWNGGFDEEWSRFAPSQVGLVEAVRAYIEAGFRRLDLGPGGQSYKYRFSDGEDQLTSFALIPPGRRRPIGRLLLVPGQVRRELSRRLTPGQKRRLRRLVGAGPGAGGDEK